MSNTGSAILQYIRQYSYVTCTNNNRDLVTKLFHIHNDNLLKAKHLTVSEILVVDIRVIWSGGGGGAVGGELGVGALKMAIRYTTSDHNK